MIQLIMFYMFSLNKSVNKITVLQELKRGGSNYLLKENDKVYFVDLDSGEMIEGFLIHNDNGHFKKLLIKFNDNNMFKLFVKR